MSSPTRAAGNRPQTPLARSQRPSIIFFRKACASANSLRASVPTTGSSRIFGYGPESSQVWKNGPQSMYGASFSSG
jgi:hypothetical protein